jgi:hypothetical protein
MSEPTMREKKEVLKNETAFSTYFSRAQAEIGDEMGGRFRQLAPAPVAGVPTYPQLPSGSPWAADPVPALEPLGYSINDLEAVGEPHELQQSVAELSGPSGDLERSSTASGVEAARDPLSDKAEPSLSSSGGPFSPPAAVELEGSAPKSTLIRRF